MQAGLSAAPPARARHRHELRTLAYVTLDQANGGIIRNLTHEGIAVQAVAAVHPGQQLQVRFELPRPRLRVDTLGEVRWANPTGQCGIRFRDLPLRMAGRIDEWIFGDLLERMASRSGLPGSMFSASLTQLDAAEEDGLIVSPAAVKVIELPVRPDAPTPVDAGNESEARSAVTTELEWISQPLSERGIVWLINALTIVAALLLFTLVFLAVTRELPQRPVAVATGAVVGLAILYVGFFELFGGVSPGARLARLAGYGSDKEEESDHTRFR
jgi:PilZ domain-containing protein